MLMHAELLTFLSLCGSSVACSPPFFQQPPLCVGNQTPHCLCSLSCEIWGMGSGCTALTAHCSEFHFTSLPKECSQRGGMENSGAAQSPYDACSQDEL